MSTVKKKQTKMLELKPEEESSSRDQGQECFLICEDCRHNSITYEPAKDGACDCDCHL